MQELKFMQIAINEANIALKKNHIPIGCAIIYQNQLIAKAHNSDFWHAEILCIQKAQKKLGKFLFGSKIFCTIKPCPMCMHAIKLAKINTLIYGCDNEKIIDFKLEVISSVEEEICKNLMQKFFKNKRIDDKL